MERRYARLEKIAVKLLCGGAAFAILIALTLLAGCAFPTHNQAKLEAIKAEAQVLIATYPGEAPTHVPKSQWPLVIASMKPEFVTVYPGGVDIMTKPYFDGGWGYFVAQNEQKHPVPEGRYSEIAQGVYWYHPY